MDLKQKIVISGLTVASFMLAGVTAKANVFKMENSGSGKIIVSEEGKCGKDGSCGKEHCKEGKTPDGKDCEAGCGEGSCGKDEKK